MKQLLRCQNKVVSFESAINIGHSGDLKVVSRLRGCRGWFIKYCTVSCEWGSHARNDLYMKEDCTIRRHCRHPLLECKKQVTKTRTVT